MPFVPAPNLVQVEIRATRALQNIENRINVDMLAAPDETNMAALANIVWTWVQDFYIPLLPNDTVIRELVLSDQSAIDGFQLIWNPGPETGAVGGGSLPNAVSIALSLRTHSRGRSARGRFFWLGLALGFMATENELNNTIAAAIETAGNELRAAIVTGGFAWVIASYFSGGVARPGGPVYYTVENTLLVDQIVDSQRRRKPGVGS